MAKKVITIEEYLEPLNDERKETISQLRKIIIEHLPKGYIETLEYGVISFIVPKEKYSRLPNGQPPAYISIASQKKYIAMHLNCYEPIPEWFIDECKLKKKRINFGKSCIRFNKLDNLPVEVIPKLVTQHSVKELIKLYENSVNKS